MCGIAGVLKSHGAPIVAEHLWAMLREMKHRGPDGSGVQIFDHVGFGHTRLSIIDVDGGHQPMSIEEGRYWITFNGEIFNYLELREDLLRRGHQFRTRSDTEVILRLYLEKGEACVEDLNGQWAFAIWDRTKKKLFLSRDRLGVRPLFYTDSNGGFVFASEIKAIFQYPGVQRQLDFKALDQILTFWAHLPPRTTFEGIRQLPPGHSLSIVAGKKSIWKHWEPEYVDRGIPAPHNIESSAEELLSLLEDAVRIRLRADVPVGAYLSGGIDSTFIAALIRNIAADRLRTFSVGFDVPDYDESAYQKEASTYLQTQHSQVRCAVGDIAESFPEVVWHAEQPLIRTAPTPLLILAGLVRENGFKVVLTGEGSDEIFGGYDIFKEAKIRRFWAEQPNSQIRPILLRKLYPYLRNVQRQPRAYLQSFFRVKDGDLHSPFFSHLPRWELTSKIKMFYSESTRSRLNDYDPLEELETQLPKTYSKWPDLCRAQYLETALLLPGYILSAQADRVSMAHSVEGRYPFLDHRVVAFASKLHPDVKLRVLDEKHLLKRAARGKIPESILNRPKQPYRAPDGQSFFGPKSIDYVEEMLSARKIEEIGIFDAASVRKLVNKFQSDPTPATRDDMALVGILSTQILVDRFRCCN